MFLQGTAHHRKNATQIGTWTSFACCNPIGCGHLPVACWQKKGVWIKVSDYILPIAPPLTISSSEINDLLLVIEETLVDVQKELFS